MIVWHCVKNVKNVKKLMSMNHLGTLDLYWTCSVVWVERRSYINSHARSCDSCSIGKVTLPFMFISYVLLLPFVCLGAIGAGWRQKINCQFPHSRHIRFIVMFWVYETTTATELLFWVTTTRRRWHRRPQPQHRRTSTTTHLHLVSH